MRKILFYFLIVGVVFLVVFEIAFLALKKGEDVSQKINSKNTDSQKKLDFVLEEITKKSAEEKIKNLPEVKEYSSELEKAGSKIQFNVEDWEEDFGVQVFEIVNQGESSHTSTFNWYRVSKKTGEVSKEF